MIYYILISDKEKADRITKDLFLICNPETDLITQNLFPIIEKNGNFFMFVDDEIILPVFKKGEVRNLIFDLIGTEKETDFKNLLQNNTFTFKEIQEICNFENFEKPF